MKTLSYSDKLKDPRWQKKRLEIMQRDNFCCSMCGDNEITLAIHHKQYNGEPWQAHNDDLTTLCYVCHTVVEDIKKIIPSFIPSNSLKQPIPGVGYFIATFNNESSLYLYTYEIETARVHLMLEAQQNLKPLVHFIINHWLKTDQETKLTDHKINPPLS
jgi:hypothetical protein